MERSEKNRKIVDETAEILANADSASEDEKEKVPRVSSILAVKDLTKKVKLAPSPHKSPSKRRKVTTPVRASPFRSPAKHHSELFNLIRNSPSKAENSDNSPLKLLNKDVTPNKSESKRKRKAFAAKLFQDEDVEYSPVKPTFKRKLSDSVLTENQLETREEQSKNPVEKIELKRH